ncbi:hypothetical protein BC826DRAFT_1014918 [Russula brevipes]|nr:hypothetical protein BC826DRAFT_1051892 [Russula brevipes]KAI0293579.1 hypothetical protein BC826DRAFT_1014918 [Russula brevipes]
MSAATCGSASRAEGMPRDRHWTEGHAGQEERGCQPDEHEWPHAHWRGPGRFLAGRARPIAGRPSTRMTNA